MSARAAEQHLARAAWVLVAGLAALASSCRKDKAAVPIESTAKTESAELPASGSAATDPSRACGPRGLPTDRHFVGEGLCARVVAHEQGPLRGIVFAPNGDLVAATSKGQIRRYRDVDHDGLYADGPPESIVWADTGDSSMQNCDLDGQDLYCGSKTGVRRWRYAPDLDRGGAAEDVVVGMAGDGRHPKHPLAVWDGWLYVVSGSADNSMSPMPADYDTHRNVVKRFALAKAGRPFQWKDGEIVIRGTRNLTAMARDPRGHIIGIDNSYDDIQHGGADIHEDNPGEPIVSVEVGKKYGYPFCFFAQRVVENGVVVPPGTPLASEVKHDTPVFKEIAKTIKSTRDDAWCKANVDRPISLLQAHSSALGMAFPRPDAPFALPSKWQGGAFVALHGSWDRDASTGNKVIWLPVDPAGRTPMPTSTADATRFAYETVFGGGKYGAPRDGAWSWKLGDAGEDPVRPVGVAISPADGALYVTSDNHAGATSANSGSIYRIALLGK